jgi:hypothetical protein
MPPMPHIPHMPPIPHMPLSRDIEKTAVLENVHPLWVSPSIHADKPICRIASARARRRTQQAAPSLSPLATGEAAWLPCIALTGRESVGRALCVTDLRDDATSWGMYVAQLRDRRQVRTLR